MFSVGNKRKEFPKTHATYTHQGILLITQSVSFFLFYIIRISMFLFPWNRIFLSIQIFDLFQCQPKCFGHEKETKYHSKNGKTSAHQKSPMNSNGSKHIWDGFDKPK